MSSSSWMIRVSAGPSQENLLAPRLGASTLQLTVPLGEVKFMKVWQPHYGIIVPQLVNAS